MDYAKTSGLGVPSRLAYINLMQKLTLSALNLIFAAFLGDALRRFNKFLKNDPRISVNRQTMCLHASALAIHTVFMFGRDIAILLAFYHPSPKNALMLNIARSGVCVSVTVSNCLVVYLFKAFSQPSEMVSKACRDIDSDSDEEVEEDPAVNFEKGMAQFNTKDFMKAKKTDQISDSESTKLQVGARDGEYEIEVEEFFELEGKAEYYTDRMTT